MERYECLKRRLAGKKGAYLLFFKLVKAYHGKIGVLGEVNLSEGIYVYVGSGLGPGGVWSRIKRHLSQTKEKKHWHIDYLTTSNYFQPLKIIVVESNEPLEEVIAKILTSLGYYTIAYPKFGSTDKKSPTHLFKITDKVKVSKVSQVIDLTIRKLEEKLKKPTLVVDI